MSTTNAEFPTQSHPATGRGYFVLEGYRLVFDFTDEGVDAINHLLRDTEDSLERLFQKALGLYRLTLDAQREGKFVGSVIDPETAAERASRLRREEAAERFGHIKETILLVVVCAIGVASLVGAYAPWLDVESKNKAHTLLAMIASGAGTYLFSRPAARAK